MFTLISAGLILFLILFSVLSDTVRWQHAY